MEMQQQKMQQPQQQIPLLACLHTRAAVRVEVEEEEEEDVVCGEWRRGCRTRNGAAG